MRHSINTSITLPVLCIISLLCLSPYLSCGQTTKGQSEISIGIGTQSIYQASEETTDNNMNNFSCSPAYTCSYRYYLTRNFSLGINFAYQRFINFETDIEPRYEQTISSYTMIAPEITVSYFNTTIGRNQLRLYGLASAGIALNHIKSYNGYNGWDTPPILPALQLTPIGARFGRALAGYVEAGLGSKGLINAGVCYRFPKSRRG